MAIEIVDFPIKHGDFPVRYVNVYQRVVPGVQWEKHQTTFECGLNSMINTFRK